MKEALCVHSCEVALAALDQAAKKAATKQLRDRLRHAARLVETVRVEEVAIERHRIALCDSV